MAKSAASIVGMTPRPEQEPFIPEPEIPLSPEEIASLRSILSSPVWKRAMARARTKFPGAFAAPGFDPKDPNACMRRIAEQQGWKEFETALWSQVLPPVQKRIPIKETYPDSGLPGNQKTK